MPKAVLAWRRGGTTVPTNTSPLYGSFLLSIFVVPIWLLAAIVRAITRRSDWRASVTRVVIPLVTLALVVGNAFLQSGIARANAERIISACTQYRTANGVYPNTMDVLVPKYLDSVPRAKYTLVLGEFSYSELDGQHRLMWVSTPHQHSSGPPFVASRRQSSEIAHKI